MKRLGISDLGMRFDSVEWRPEPRNYRGVTSCSSSLSSITTLASPRINRFEDEGRARARRQCWKFGLLAVLAINLLLATHFSHAAQEPSTLEGRVINTNGFAIPNALVFIHFAVPRDGKPSVNPTTYPDCGKHARSDAQGNFKITGLNPDFRFRLLVTADGYHPDYVKNVDPLFSSTIARLKPLRKIPVLNESRVIGKLIDPNGRPVAGAAINVNGTRRGSSTSFGSSTTRSASLAVTDEKGEFFIDCTYDVTSLTVLIEPRALAKRRMWLDTGKAHLIRLNEGVTVTGRLLRDGEPLAGASVSMATRDQEASVSMRGFDVATDRKGRFTLLNIPSENYFYLYTQMKEVRGLGVTLAMQSVTTGTNGTKVDLGDLATKPSFTIMGRVVLSDGKPIPPKVGNASSPRIYIGTDEGYDSQDVVLGPEGVFEFGGVPGGRIDMSLRVPGYRVSAKNPSKDWLNENRLVGLVETNYEDLVIQLEPTGPRNVSFPPSSFPNDTERQPRDKPLRSAMP